MTSIIKEEWNTANNTEDKREKIQALSLAKECCSMKLDLLTNANVVEDAVRFVSSNKSKDKENLKSSDEGDKESNEPDYDEDKDQLEEEQEENTGEFSKLVCCFEIIFTTAYNKLPLFFYQNKIFSN